MSKNIIMQQKTASGYEELYPKADGDGSVIVNNTTNQFLGGGSTVGDALEYLSKFGMYWWKKVERVPVWIEVKTQIQSDINWGKFFKKTPSPNISVYGTEDTFGPIDLWMSKEIIIDINGKISLKNPSQLQLKGMYYNGAYQQPQVQGILTEPCYLNTQGAIYYSGKQGSNSFPSYSGTLHQYQYGSYYYGARFSYNARQATECYRISSAIQGYEENITFICSSNPNEYPDLGGTDSSGAKYWKIGQPWDFLPKMGKIETGYYLGTGTHDVALTFENAPSFVFVVKEASTSGGRTAMSWCKDSPSGILAASQGNGTVSVTQSGNTVTFTDSQMSENAIGYYYFAITQ